MYIPNTYIDYCTYNIYYIEDCCLKEIKYVINNINLFVFQLIESIF